MIQKLLKTGVLMIPLVAIGGCQIFGTAGEDTYNAPAECVFDETTEKWNSLILNKVADPQALGVMIALGNFQALKYSDLYDVGDAWTIIGEIETKLDEPGLYWVDLIEYIRERITWFNQHVGDEVLLATMYLDVLAKPVELSDCDKAIVRRHLREKQAMALRMADRFERKVEKTPQN